MVRSAHPFYWFPLLILWGASARAHEAAVTNPAQTPAVRFEIVLDPNQKDLPENYRAMVTDFHRAGGKGRTYFVHTDMKELAGPYLAVDRLPGSVRANGTSLFTRDWAVLNSLKNLHKSGAPLFLQSVDQQVDAQVFREDEVGKGLREAAFPKSKKNYALSVSPSATEDILVHEAAHIHQKTPTHPLAVFLEQLRSKVDEAAFRAIRRALEELWAYQAQYRFLEKQKKAGLKSVRELVKTNAGYTIKEINFEKLREQRLKETTASVGMYMQNVSNHLQGLSNETRCQTIDQVRDAISGMGTIEENLVYTYFAFNRCASPVTTPLTAPTNR